ncbi:MAG TPA: hypothetical protein PK142_02575 [bacterium]|nr:hypothetical protein [bacterium]
MEEIKQKDILGKIKKDTEIVAEDALSQDEKKNRLDKEMPGNLNFREATAEEKEKLNNRVPTPQKEALKICAKIFNKECNHPWYTIGSIAFLINANESKKQPDDIDIIFHEKDFTKIKEEFSKLGFESGIAQNTGCPYVKGKIKVLIKNEQGVEEFKEIEMEAFGQKTDTPNGLINPGAINTNYNIIKNSLSDNPLEDFNVLDREGQIELYFKNLAEEIKHFNFEASLENYEKFGEEYYSRDKAGKFINRLANLFELNNNNAREIIIKAARISDKDLEKKKLLKEFLNLSNSFSENIELGDFDNFENDTKEGKEIEKNVLEVLGNKDIQDSVEKLKETIAPEIKNLISTYKNIKQELENIDENNELREDLYNKIEGIIQEKEKIAKILLSDYKNIDISENNYKNLAPYIFSVKFIQNYLHPFTKKIEKFKEELAKELVA